MDGHNTAARATAIALGVALTAGGTSLLFGDVIFGSVAFTQKHFQTICIVLGTLLSAHVAKEAWISRHVAAVLGFAAIAAAGTGLICYNSLGRQAEGVMNATAEHDEIVAERTKLKADLAKERKSLAEKKADRDTECADGEGPKCKGKRITVKIYEESVKGIEARLSLLAPPKVVDPSAERFGEYAAVLGYNREKAKTLASLIVPYLVTILFEFGTVVSFGYGFSPKRVVRTARQPSPSDTLQSSFAAPDSEIPAARRLLGPSGPEDRNGPGGLKAPDRPRPAPKDSGPKTGGLSKDEVLQHVLTELALGRTIPSQDALVGLSGIRKQRVSEWVREWEADGLIPRRRTVGRCKVLAG